MCQRGGTKMHIPADIEFISISADCRFTCHRSNNLPTVCIGSNLHQYTAFPQADELHNFCNRMTTSSFSRAYRRMRQRSCAKCLQNEYRFQCFRKIVSARDPFSVRHQVVQAGEAWLGGVASPSSSCNRKRLYEAQLRAEESV